MEDREITDLLYEHREEGLQYAMECYNGILHEVANNILQNHADADECVSDAYKKAWDRIPPYRPTHLRVFLCKLTKQIAIDRYRHDRAKKYGKDNTVLFSELSDIPEPATEESGEISEAITAFLQTADVECRIFFIRRYFLAESVQSIAERFGRTPDCVSVKLHRTKQKLLKYLQKKGLTV